MTQFSQPAAAPDDDAVRRAKAEIQTIVRQISELSRQDISPERYYEEFLNKVVSALAAPGGAIWTVSDTGQLQLGYQINLRQTGLAENPIAQEQHGRLVHRVLSAPVGPGFKEGAVVPPHSGFSADDELVDAASGEHLPANATDFLLVLAPVHNDQGAQGVVEVFQRPGARPQVQQGYLNFLLQVCELAGDYLRGRRLALLADKQSLWEQLESFTRLAHDRLDVRQSAYTIANEGRRLIGADRVTVAVGRGRKPKIEAISGQDTFDTRSNVSTLLTKLARAVAKTGEDVWYTGDTSKLAPQVEKALDAYVDESQTKAMAILPLVDRRGVDPEATEEDVRKGGRREGDVIGALIVEQMVDNRIADGFTQRVDVVRSHSETALGNALEHEGLFLMPLWKTLGKATWMFRRHTLPKTVLVTGAIAGAIAASLLVQKEFLLEGDGKLRPRDVANVFAQIDGTVKSIDVTDEAQVERGQALVELESVDLEKDLTATRGRLNTIDAEHATINREITGQRGDELSPEERAQKLGRRASLYEELISLRAELKLLETKQQQLTVTSPLTGQVITSRVEERLMGRPVRRGQVLLEIADPEGEWILEVEMPEKRLGHITKAIRESPDKSLEVEFLLATNTEQTLTGRLTEPGIAASAEVRGDDGNTVLLTVEFDQKEFREAATDPKVGAEVKARVHCGRASLAYAYLHDLVDFVRSKILFRL
ncbi:multidrug resistance protein MdtN [Botrimarina colliarenosi]|uniref:Multidrug resistance protein MdtN n=1 Tax=Botrimarina colliarenosi TaxID=2528001 RepID=A0A5C6A6D5_9BACT|nr:efflux RND transporter periplasmic adaptor subunit [Botrimarina colliarenosi]TWT94838.1 multidrug resistance protein MdtN [Botrimarina colliarenosi]